MSSVWLNISLLLSWKEGGIEKTRGTERGGGGTKDESEKIQGKILTWIYRAFHSFNVLFCLAVAVLPSGIC